MSKVLVQIQSVTVMEKSTTPHLADFEMQIVTNAGEKGHLAEICHGEPKKVSKGSVTSRNPKQPSVTGGNPKQPTHLVKDAPGGEDFYAETMYHIREESKAKAFEVTMELCGEPHKL